MRKSYSGTKRTDENSIMKILYFFDKPYWSYFRCYIGEFFTNLDFYNPIGHIAKLRAPMVRSSSTQKLLGSSESSTCPGILQL